MKPVRVPPQGFHLVDGNNYATTVTITASASINTKGSWSTVIASTPFDAAELTISLQPFALSGTQRSALWDLAIGPSASPTMLVENFQISYITAAGGLRPFPFYRFPMWIPTGSELIMRMQSPVASLAVPLSMGVVGGVRNLLAFERCYTYGADTANSDGQTIALGGVNNAKGSWVELVASTAETFYALGLGLGVDWGPGLTGSLYGLDVGVGAAGSEVVIAQNMTFQTANTETMFNIFPEPMPIPNCQVVPAGSRIAVRAAASSQFTPPNVTLHGFAGVHGYHSRSLLTSSNTLVGRLEG